METVFQDAENSYKNDGQPFLTGSLLRSYAGKENPDIRSLMPLEVVGEIPWNITEALIKPGIDKSVQFLSDVLKQLVSEAGRYSKLIGFELNRQWKPPVFPFLAVAGGERNPLAYLIIYQKMPQVFSPLSTYEWSCIFHQAAPDILELRFFCLCLSPRWLQRYESMKEMGGKAVALAREQENTPVEYGEIYRALINKMAG